MITTFKTHLWKSLRTWLGIDKQESSIKALDWGLIQFHKEWSDQMRMVGIDMGMKHDQTIIIFISRLGREGEGTVRIIPAAFKSYGELQEFIKFTQRSVDPEKLIINAPYYIQRELRGKDKW